MTAGTAAEGKSEDTDFSAWCSIVASDYLTSGRVLVYPKSQ